MLNKRSVQFLVGFCSTVLVVVSFSLIFGLLGYRITHQERLGNSVSQDGNGSNVSQEFNSSNLKGSRVVRQLDDSTSISSETTWNSILQDSDQRLSYSIVHLGEIINERWKAIGLEMLNEVYKSSLSSIDQDLVVSLALNIAISDDCASAFDQALSLEVEQEHRQWILSKIAMGWGNQDPLVALDSIVNANLQPQDDRIGLGKHVIASWSRDDPMGILTSLELLPSSLQRFGEHVALEEISRRSPSEGVEHIQMVSNPRRALSLAKLVVRNWIRESPSDALQWVNSSTAKELGFNRELQAVAFGELAVSDAGLAMDLALKEPLKMPRGGLEVHVIRQVARDDVDFAMELLPRVRVAGQGYAEAYVYVGVALIESNDFSRALELGQHINRWNRSKYFMSIAEAWARQDGGSLLQYIGNIPIPEARSFAASYLVYSNSYTGVLNENQMKQAADYLSPRQRRQMSDRLLGFGNTERVLNEQESIDLGSENGSLDRYRELRRVSQNSGRYIWNQSTW